MANTITEICNAALARIGVDRLTDFDSDQSIVAQRCRDIYAIERNATFRAYDWNCITRRAQLAANATAPAWGYANAFDLPSGSGAPGSTDPLWCERICKIESEAEADLIWKVEGRQILTDEGGPLNILYVARVTDVAQYDSMLVSAIAQRLAAALAYDRTGSQAVSADKFQVFAAMIREARSIDAREGTPDRFGPDPNDPATGWLESRI